ncbi:hypothetical protein AK812_SmicGene19606 [Symbiodinium microadriaticum]|uniref:Laminin G domain-containing protein n=1 Tax=Symbiodinium microadriaticum TaxID=2951 RepID=A0A1Q9DS39_SYMMI|nr:hypothetical protein AK812_SmicGene19606 [Symbiodinium microadriaticum]
MWKHPHQPRQILPVFFFLLAFLWQEGEGEKKDKDEEEEPELFVGDCVRRMVADAARRHRICGSMAEVKKHLEAVDMTWEGSFMGVLGKNGVVKVVNVHEGPELSLPGASLTVVEDDESDKESVDKGSDDEEEEEEEERVRVPLRVNMRVEETSSVETVILELGESETNVKYEDFRFTKNCLPTGIEVVGDGADLEKNRAGQSYLLLKKTLALAEILLDTPTFWDAWMWFALQIATDDWESLFQASFPDPHSTDELCVVLCPATPEKHMLESTRVAIVYGKINGAGWCECDKVAEDKPHKRKWKVLTKENGLVVNAEADPNSKELCRLPANAVVVEDGIPPKRLPTGERRLRIRYKADAAKQADGDLLAIDTMEPEEFVVEVEAGYFGNDFGAAATAIRICSKGVLKTLNFRPGVEGGLAGVDGEAGANMGWTPRDRLMHIVRITIRKTGWHTFQIIDASDSEKTWSKDFKVLGWFDDKGVSGISLTDPDNEELELGKEREYHNSGTHKLRLRRLGEASADMDDKFDPRGWVTIRKTDMELVEEAHGQKPPKGPQCFLKAGLSERPTTSNRYLRSDRWHTVTITADCQDRTVLIFLDGIQATEKEINIGITAGGLGTDDAGRRVQGMEQVVPRSRLKQSL